MTAFLVLFAAFIGLAVILGLWIARLYNRLVELRNRYKNLFSQIDVQLKRRYDLIPNLVEVAKGYLKHERETLEAVIQARNVAAAAAKAAAANPGDPATLRQLGAAETGLAGVLSRLLVVTEQYPNLKADGQMMQLTEELTSTENKIAFARQAYNDGVMVYNTARETFPTVLISGAFGFHPAELFQVDNPAERVAPKVNFSGQAS